MVYKKKRNNTVKTLISILFILLLVVVLVVLFNSLIYKKHPVQVFRSWFIQERVEGQIDTYSKEEILVLLDAQSQLNDSLSEELEKYQFLFGIEPATIEVNTDGLNLRASPTITSDIIKRIDDESLIGIIYCEKERKRLAGEWGRWCRIKYAGREGWVWGNYLNKEVCIE